jgi:hypothetical protein
MRQQNCFDETVFKVNKLLINLMQISAIGLKRMLHSFVSQDTLMALTVSEKGRLHLVEWVSMPAAIAFHQGSHLSFWGLAT